MKCRKLLTFSMSIESLEIRDLKSADGVALPSITHEGGCEIRLVELTKHARETDVATNEDFVDQSPNSEDRRLSGEAANDALRRKLVHEIRKGTTIEMHSGGKFVFDSPNSGRLYQPDGTSRRFVDIDFTYGNRGWFDENGPWRTAAHFQYNGKQGRFNGTGEFLQAKGDGFVEVFFGGREIVEGSQPCTPAATSWIGDKATAQEDTGKGDLFQTRDREHTNISTEAGSGNDTLVAASDAESRSATYVGNVKFIGLYDGLSCDPEHIRLPLTIVPPLASDMPLTLVDDLFASERLNWA